MILDFTQLYIAPWECDEYIITYKGHLVSNTMHLKDAEALIEKIKAVPIQVSAVIACMAIVNG